MVCSVIVVSPCFNKLTRRTSIGERPSVFAMQSMCRSIANKLCGAPNPRNAPCGGAFVATAFARTRTAGHSYGPPA